MAIAVALGTTFGFFYHITSPITIALRALSHVVFAVIGAFLFTKKSKYFIKERQANIIHARFQAFNLVIALSILLWKCLL